jgi:hypothetical protein
VKWSTRIPPTVSTPNSKEREPGAALGGEDLVGRVRRSRFVWRTTSFVSALPMISVGMALAMVRSGPTLGRRAERLGKPQTFTRVIPRLRAVEPIAPPLTSRGARFILTPKGMKLRDVKRALKRRNCSVVSDTGDHTKWVCPCGDHAANIPRHKEISPGVVKDTITRMKCLPEGWLR